MCTMGLEMSVNQKYFYLKLKDNFFDTDEMIVVESMPDGYKYSNILMKLYLRSLKYEGRLMFNDRIPFNSTMLASVTRHSVGDVEKAVQIFRDLNLIEVLENGAIYMLDIQNFIGKSTTEADRIRDYRNKLNDEKKQLNVQKSYICTPEIELEKDIYRGDNAREEYLLFRMAGEGIKNPIAFKKTIMSGLQDPTSDESNDFADWQSLMNTWPKILNDLYNDFCSFGYKNRKKCKDIATDHRQDYGVNITPMMFEIAFYESCKARQGKGVA